MSHDVAVDDVHLSYGATEALRGVSFTLPAGAVCGLLGRNGSGKTSLLSLLAGRRRPTSGRVTVGGADVWENAAVMPRVALVGEAAKAQSLHSVAEARQLGRRLRPTWDDELAGRLLDRFAIPAWSKVDKLSRGQRAAVGATFGLASGAPVTLFDEAHLGMDAPSRTVFYDEVLRAAMDGGRTIVLSTHHIDEVAALFSEVVIVDRGRLVAHAPADDLRGRGIEVTGPADAVDRFTAGLTVLSTRRLGGTKAAVVHGALDDDRRRRAAEAGLDLGPLPLQELFIHLTEEAPAP
jgi:ABC-2 type transport system ATP-binding protein